MSIRLRVVILGVACTALAVLGCGSDDPAGPVTHDPSFPETCADIARARRSETPAPDDGQYTLYVDGEEIRPWTAFCRGMSSTNPRTFLNLERDTNYSEVTKAGETTPRRTRFSRVQVEFDPLVILHRNFEFARTDGTTAAADFATSQIPYGVARAENAVSGTAVGVAHARIDLAHSGFMLGKDFVLDPEFFFDKCTTIGGSGGSGTVTATADRRTVALTASSPTNGATVHTQTVSANCSLAATSIGDSIPIEYSGE